jgi:LPXTG-site transpeptidase (sortase) family protein
VLASRRLAVQDNLRIGIGRALTILGLVLLVVWLAAAIDGGLSQTWLARRLGSLGERSKRAGLLQVAAATRHEAATSGLIGRLEIPRIHLSVYMLEGIGGTALRRGVGHVPGTPFPGERGNVGLAGHRDTYFRKLHDIGPGDTLTLTTPDGAFAYQVDSILIVNPARGDLLRPDRRIGLTLVTCYPFHYVAPRPIASWCWPSRSRASPPMDLVSPASANAGPAPCTPAL